MHNAQGIPSVINLGLISKFDHPLDYNHLFPWFLTATGYQLSLYVSEFILTAKHIICKNDHVHFLGTFIHLNGRPLLLPISYKQMFILICNKNCHLVTFFVEGDRNQVGLQCKIAFENELNKSDKILFFFQEISKSMKRFQEAIQAIGVKKKFNKSSLQVKKLQLKLKRHLVEALKSNSSQEPNAQLLEKKKQNKCVIKICGVLDSTPEKQEDPQIKKGGYFKVERKKSLLHELNGEMKEKDLAWKTAINANSLSMRPEEKIRKQIQLVEKIIDPKYTLTYYLQQSNPSCVYMEYVSGLLKDCIYKQELSFLKMVHLAQQMVEAVEILHKSKIVHRDLKPENILVDEMNNLKLIDFAESAEIDEAFVEHQNPLGCTLPYSPIQCSLGKEEGFNKKQIDFWSISVILYEMAFKSIPLYYTRWIGHQILLKWKVTGDFSIFPIYRKKRGAMGIETIISLVAISGIQINPQQRLTLKTHKAILSAMRQFGESIVNHF